MADEWVHVGLSDIGYLICDCSGIARVDLAEEFDILARIHAGQVHWA